MRMTALHYSVRSQIKMLAGLLIAATLSLNATAEESKRQPRLDQDISREMPERLDRRSHKRHAARETIFRHPDMSERRHAVRSGMSMGETFANQASNGEKRNPAVTRFKSNTDTDQTPNAGQVKQKANKPEYQTNQRQRKTQRQHKQNEARPTFLPQTTSAIIEANISSRETIIQIMFETETIIEVTSSKGMTAIARTKDGPKEGLLNTGAFTMRIMIRSRHSNRKGKEILA